MKYFSTKEGHNFFFFFLRRKRGTQAHLVIGELQETDGFLFDIFILCNADFASCSMIAEAFKNVSYL